VRDKSKSWILAGLSLAFTKMDIDIWNQTSTNTNTNESAHANINQDGHSLSLLAAIYHDFDQRQWHAAKTYEQYNTSSNRGDYLPTNQEIESIIESSIPENSHKATKK
ncbi:7492_t:CDS:2, partial [Dentiscutata heterogama]